MPTSPAASPQPGQARREAPRFDLTVLEPLEEWRAALKQRAVVEREAKEPARSPNDSAIKARRVREARERAHKAEAAFRVAFIANIDAEDP